MVGICYYWIGPESFVYHTNRECYLLNNPYQYWPIQSSETPPLGRRLCIRCSQDG